MCFLIGFSPEFSLWRLILKGIDIMQITEIPVEEILEDFFFCFTSPSDFSTLEHSIRTSGIETPLHVLSTEKCYRLISGFSRFKVAVKLQMSKIPAVIHSDGEKPENIFLGILLEHLTCRTLTLVEKSRIIHILDELNIPPGRIQKEFLLLLNIPESLEVMNDLRNLLKFSPEVLEYIERYNLSLKQVKIFKNLSYYEQTMMADLGLSLQIRAVELSDIISMFYDVSCRDDIPIKEIFERIDGESILKNSDLARNEKLSRIKEELQRMRYPKLTFWNENLEKLKKKEKLPMGIQLSWDRSLEAPGLKLRAEIKSMKDVDRIISYLSAERTKKQFEEMLKVI